MTTKELELALRNQMSDQAEMLEVLLLIREVHRRRAILDEMSAEAGETGGERMSS